MPCCVGTARRPGGFRLADSNPVTVGALFRPCSTAVHPRIFYFQHLAFSFHGFLLIFQSFPENPKSRHSSSIRFSELISVKSKFQTLGLLFLECLSFIFEKIGSISVEESIREGRVLPRQVILQFLVSSSKFLENPV